MDTHSTSTSFTEVRTLLQLLVQFILGCIFQYQINSFLIIKVSIKAQNIRVSKMTLDFNFTVKLTLNLRLFQLALEKHLQCHNMIALCRDLAFKCTSAWSITTLCIFLNVSKSSSLIDGNSRSTWSFQKLIVESFASRIQLSISELPINLLCFKTQIEQTEKPTIPHV